MPGAPTQMQEDHAVYCLAAMVARGVSSQALFEAMTGDLVGLLSARSATLAAIDAELTARTISEWRASEPDGQEDEWVDLEAPILVDGRIWGVLTVSVPAHVRAGQPAERIMQDFGELLALAVHAEQERAGLAQLEAEQRALRSVATLVARGVGSQELFAAVTRAAGEVLGVDVAALGRIEPEGGVAYVSTWARFGQPDDLADLLEPTGDDLAGLLEPTVTDTNSVTTPVMVEGRLWGAMTVRAAGDDPPPPDTAQRLSAFTELLETAIAAVSSREQLARLVDDEATLRRVATLVARGSEPNRLFEAVTEEAGRLLGADLAALGRIEEGGRTLKIVATWSVTGNPPPHMSVPLTGENVVTIAATGVSARQSGVDTVSAQVIELARSLQVAESVAAPIVVQGAVWGVMVVSAAGSHSLQPQAELRLWEFTRLVATAIANAHSRDELAASRARIVAAADGARARIERDLQDGVQQRLASLGLSLRTAMAALPEPEPTQLHSALERLTRGFADAYAELQEIARGIHPAVLAAGGLRPAVATLARRSPVTVQVDIPELPRLSDHLEVAAYYAVAEALTNAIKHAQPSEIKIVAGLNDGFLHVSVTDDGVGGADLSAGSGLIGLRDRIESLSGAMTVTSPPGGGTSVSIMVPVTAGESGAQPDGP